MKRIYAHGLLILAAILWGLGNVAQKNVLDHIGPFTAVGFRCMIASLAISPLLAIDRGALRNFDFLKSALPVALSFTLALAIQQVGYQSTSVTNASFLVNTGTVMVPLAVWILLRDRPSVIVIAAASSTLLGVWLMSGATTPDRMNTGDIACIISAGFYAAWMIMLDQHGKRFNFPFATALVQFMLAFVIFVPLGLATDAGPVNEIAKALPNLLVLGVFSTATAFGLQVYAQRHTSASTAAILVSGESIFGALGAYMILGEVTPAMGLAGAVIIFLSITLVALAPSAGTKPIPASARLASS